MIIDYQKSIRNEHFICPRGAIEGRYIYISMEQLHKKILYSPQTLNGQCTILNYFQNTIGTKGREGGVSIGEANTSWILEGQDIDVKLYHTRVHVIEWSYH